MKENCYLFFSTLASKLKVNIILALREHPKSVNELARELGEERSKVSHALKTLKRCRFVHAKKQGRKQMYSVNKDTITPLLKIVDKHVKEYCNRCEAAKMN